MKSLTVFLILCILFSPILSMGVFPEKSLPTNVAKVSSQLRDKNYTVETGRRFHIGLKKNESVKYVVTAPIYLSKTAIGIATDEHVKKLRIVMYTQLNKDSEERSFFGQDIESTTFVQEITEKSYRYVIELTLLDTDHSEGYSSVDVLVAYAQLPLKTAEEVKDFYYDHLGEIEIYNDPIKAKKAGNQKSNTGKMPCSAIDYGVNCAR